MTKQDTIAPPSGGRILQTPRNCRKKFLRAIAGRDDQLTLQPGTRSPPVAASGPILLGSGATEFVGLVANDCGDRIEP